MTMSVSFDDVPADDADRELVSKIEGADQALRQNFAGFDVDAVLPEVRQSFSHLAVEVSDEQLRAYAQAISDRSDFELVLR